MVGLAKVPISSSRKTSRCSARQLRHCTRLWASRWWTCLSLTTSCIAHWALGLSGILAGYFSTAVVLRKLSPPFGKLKAVEGKKEGDFRGLHSRLLANAEEISFYGGADIERVFLVRSFKDLQRWMEGIYSLKIRYNMLEDMILKYSWSAFGYLVTSLPVFLPAWGGLAVPWSWLMSPRGYGP